MKKILVLLVVAALTAMTACSSTNTTDNRKNEAVTNTTANESKEANAANTTEVANTAEAAGKVYSLENDGVDETLFNEALSQFPSTVPERIVTTSVPLTEMLYLLGITPVGVPTSTNQSLLISKQLIVLDLLWHRIWK